MVISTVHIEAAVPGLNEAAQREPPSAYISILQLPPRTIGNVPIPGQEQSYPKLRTVLAE
jgi:hypothetical protein